LILKNIRDHDKLENKFVNIAKILIILFASFSILGNFVPFFEGSNSYYYGIASILLIEDGATMSNPFLEKYQRDEFVVENWLLTQQNELIPMSGQGLITLGSIFYLFGGYFGLYYLSPIFFIILLIVSERITTNLFGKYAGLITLILLSTSNLLFRNSIQLQTESVICLMFILGAYFLIKFGKTNKNYLILIASTFFVISTTIKLSGIIIFPFEFLILGILIINNLIKSRKERLGKIISKNIKTITLAAIPWIIFFLFFIAGNISNFDDPLITYGELNQAQNENYDSSIFSLIEFEKSDFENVKQYSKYLLPYIFVGVFDNIENNFENDFGKNWIGIIPIIILSLMLIFSFKAKNKKLEILIMLLLIFSTIWFFSSITTEERAEKGVPGRYVLPAFVLSSMIFGYMIEKILQVIKNNKNSTKKIFQYTFISIIVLFVIISYNFTSSVSSFEQDNYFKNPYDYKRDYPLKEKGINENSIIVTPNGQRGLEYNLIPFNPTNSNESIELLKSIVKDNNVLVFKIPFTFSEVEILSMVEKNGFVFKEYSKTFCKIELSSSDKSDKNCINNEPIR